MAVREPVYLPRISDALLVPVNPADDAIFKRRVSTIKSLITELEDENNLIAYKIAKTRRRIEEKKARIAAQQVPESKGFWGSRKATDTEEVPKPSTSARKKDRTKSRPRPSKTGNSAAKQASARLPIENVIPPLSSDELTQLHTGRDSMGHASKNGASREPDDRTSTPRRSAQKPVDIHAQSPNPDQNGPSREPDGMDVDDFDDY